ncbi:hypothetical protein LLE49_22150 [Alicyclobacillus tolerans]|uniref:hypothetical protein n=1 Tax=Alicyclobacillus tolerans TaxID=90970 RepID=UPI001F2C0CF0|nr:hypothetical protein [Alicyclobacillus tolerans]MCF8567425.1 hypothetical protein [Alicyclobacillus tolerans]
MERSTKSKLQRQEERQMIEEYHKMVTEEALEPLWKSFVAWKEGTLPYDELTERIHLFHKTNQEIYRDFNYTERYLLVLRAKMKLGRLTDQDYAQYGAILDRWKYDEEID